MFIRILLLASVIFTTFSCGLIKSTRESLLGKPKPSEYQEKPSHVSREEYDKLMSKYEELNRKTQMAKDDPYKDREAGVHEIIGDLNAANEKADGFETAELESPEASMPINIETSDIPQSAMSVETEVNNWKEGLNSFRANDFVKAAVIFKGLTSSPIIQIRARALYYAAVIKFIEKDYAKALPLFEVVMNNYSSSIVAVKALKYAERCTEALGDQKKSLQYREGSQVFGELLVGLND